MSSYPSIISQPGSYLKNLPPVIRGLTPLIDKATNAESGKRRILEIASFPYDHISAFARKWPDVEWWGTCRDVDEANEVNQRLNQLTAQERKTLLNLAPPGVLDIIKQDQWSSLVSEVQGHVPGEEPAFEGVIMLNLVHCCPEGAPENVFRQLSPQSLSGRKLLNPGTGWVAAYGAYKNDDGTYKSENDKEFERTHIQVADASLGLRTVKSITEMAEKWGFTEESRQEMPNGNLFIIWRVKPAS